jgi:hypothetical protein
VGAELVKLLSHYIVYIGQQTGLIHSSIYNMTSRGLLLFETKKPRFTWESTGHSRSRLCCNTGSENGGPRISTETWDQSVELPSIPVALDSAADVNLVTPSLRLAMEDVCFDSGQVRLLFHFPTPRYDWRYSYMRTPLAMFASFRYFNS